MKVHMRKCHTSTKYSCSKGESKFNDRNDINPHDLVHTLPSYQCNQDDQPLTVDGSSNNHLRTHESKIHNVVKSAN